MLTTEEINFFINLDKGSKIKRYARKGRDYYKANHDIKHYRMFYYDSDGNLVEDTTRSNTKIAHTFFHELVDQEVQYMLSNDEGFVKSDDPELQNKLDDYFNYNENFIAEIHKLLTGCVSKGFEYMYAYRNEDDELSFMCADSLGVVEVRDKDTDDGCSYVIYWYIDKIVKEDKKIKKIQVWSANDVTYYIQEDDGKIILDPGESINPRYHALYKKKSDNNIYGKSFGYIPFFRLDNNEDQRSGLYIIKDLIDDYDLMASSLSNNLIDFDHPLYAVSGFEGDNLEELQQNIKTKKMIGVGEGGNVEIKTIDIPFQARQAKLDLDEKNIYRFGMGLNSSGLKDTNATTNIAIKALYSLLDLKCSKLEIKLKQFMRKILKAVLKDINEREGTDYQSKQVYFKFIHKIMSNEQELAQTKLIEAQTKETFVNNMITLFDYLPSETIIKEICAYLDIDYEEIKDKLPKPKEAYEQVDDVTDTLNKTVPDE